MRLPIKKSGRHAPWSRQLLWATCSTASLVVPYAIAPARAQEQSTPAQSAQQQPATEPSAQEDQLLEELLQDEQTQPAPAGSPPAAATTETPGEAPVAATPDPATSVEDSTAAPVVRQPEAYAREGGATQLENIVVTASKRSKLQRDIPGSVGALQGEELENMKAEGLQDYLKRVPGVTLIQGGGENNSIPIIRGIATSIGFGNTQLPVGIYADDLPFSDLQQTISVPDLAPFDFERVEVLKGPQGTLFGSGALAGAIRYILKKPTFGEWEGKLNVISTQNPESDSLGRSLSGALNIPIGENFALRAVANVRDTPGVYDNTSRFMEEDVNDVEQEGGRVLAAWNATEKLKLSAFHLTQESKVADIGFSSSRDRFERNDTPFASPSETSFGGTNLLATYDFDWARLLSSTNRIVKDASGLGHGERGFGTNIPDPSADPDCNSACDIGFEDLDFTQVVNIFDNELLAYTQEFRISSPEGGSGNWEWLAGISYLDYRQDLRGTTSLPFTSPETGLPGAGVGIIDGLFIFPLPTPIGGIEGTRELQFLVRRFDNQATEEALFGEATRKFGDHWEATIGGRAFKTHYEGDHFIAGLQAPIFLNKTEHTEHAEIDEKGINPRFSVRYLHNENMQVYALASKGFQFGGIQVNPPNLAFSAIANQFSGGQGATGFGFVPYKSSTLWNYELGLRTEWLDNRLRFDTVLFYLDWTDLQLQQPVNLDPTEPFDPADLVANIPLFTVIGNIGAAHSEGAEISLEVAPFPGVVFTSSAAFISALTDVVYIDGNNMVIPAGNRLPGSPRFQWSNVLNIGGALPYFSNWQGGLSLAHTHSGEAFADLQNETPIGNYDTLDIGLNLARADIRWLPTLGLNVSNITNERAAAFAIPDGRIANFVLVRPRTAQLSLGWQF